MAEDRERGVGSPRSRTSRWVRCIPPGIQQMPALRAGHHHQPIYNIDPDMGDLIPPDPPGPPASRPPTYTATLRTTPAPRRRSRGRSRHGWPPPRQRGGPAGNGRGWRRSHERRRRGGRWGPRVPLRTGTIGSGTEARSPTPLGAKPSPW